MRRAGAPFENDRQWRSIATWVTPVSTNKSADFVAFTDALHVCEAAKEIGCPGETTAFGQKPLSEPIRAGLVQHPLDQALVVRPGGRRKGERHGTEPKLEQAVAGARLQVIVALA